MGKGTGRSFGHLSPSARALSIRLAARLEQEPATLLRLVYEDFEETRSRGIFMIFRKLVRIAHILDLAFVVVHQLQQHVTRAHEIRIIVLDALKLCDVSEGADGGAAHFAHALGQNIDTLFDLPGLLVEQEVIIPEMRPGDVPVEVLGLDVEGKRIRQQRIQCGGDLSYCLLGEIGWRVERWGSGAWFKPSDFVAQEDTSFWLMG